MSLRENSAALADLIQQIEMLPETETIVEAELQDKTVSPSESQQIVTADAGFDGLSSVVVGAVSANYIGSGVARKSETDLTASGSSIFVPAGYYGTNASKSVAVVAQATPSIDVDANGLVTASATQASGYVEGSTTSDTMQLTTREATTITPSESVQTIDAQQYLTGVQTISAIPTTYVGSGVARQTAKTVTPSTSEQTAVATNTYTTGVVKVAAIQTEEKTANANGEVVPSAGKYLTKVTVSVPAGIPSLQSKSVSPTESEQTVSADSGYDGLSSVTVSAIDSGYVGSGVTRKSAATITPSESVQEIAANQYLTGKQTISAISTTYVGSGVTKQEAKTVSPTESEQTAVAANTYTTGIVKVGAISATYVGSGIARKASADLTASGATVSVPAGYYASNASKAVTTGSIAVNTPSINASTGVVTASTTLTTAGYVATNPSSKTLNLTTQAAKTVTPTTSEQTAVASGVYTTGAVKVAAIQTETKTVSDNGTFTPTSGKYFSSVTVNIPIQKYYTGSSDPASSLGSNGDLYLKV